MNSAPILRSANGKAPMACRQSVSLVPNYYTSNQRDAFLRFLRANQPSAPREPFQDWCREQTLEHLFVEPGTPLIRQKLATFACDHLAPRWCTPIEAFN